MGYNKMERSAANISYAPTFGMEAAGDNRKRTTFKLYFDGALLCAMTMD